MSTAHEHTQEAIAFFEKMLLSLPDDRVAIEFLADAYEQTGQTEKARAMWRRLVPLVANSGDTEHTRILKARLAQYANDPEFTAATGLPGAPPKDAPARVDKSAPAAGARLEPAQLRMATAFEEVNLAWLLHERGFLDATEYEALTDDLTGGDLGIPEVPVSALCGLHHLHPDKTDAAVLLLAELYATVPLRLDVFEVDPLMRNVLPAAYVRIKGAIPFANMGRTLLVALLNPANQPLREEVQRMTGRPCLFFLAHPANIGPALEAFPV